MSNNAKYTEFASGWVKQSKAGSEYISATSNLKKSGLKILLQDESGETKEVASFAVFFVQDKKNEKAPDVRFVVDLSQ